LLYLDIIWVLRINKRYMAIQEGFNISPEHERDMGTPDVPDFFFTEAERQERKEKGKTEDEITAEEIAIATRIRDQKMAA
jgi:hypothetical protein